MSEINNGKATILTYSDPPPVNKANQNGKSRYIIVCDHATNVIPEKLKLLSLDKKSLEKHIALDIGALGVAKTISDILDAPLLYTGFSRLVIDVNRSLNSKDSIPEVSDGIVISGNKNLSLSARKQRASELFEPYHEAISSIITERFDFNKMPILIAVHSFTPILQNIKRIWDIGITYDNSTYLAEKIMTLLKIKSDYNIGNNQPYSVNRQSDYTIPIHGDDHSIKNVLFEIRQDHLSDDQGIARWGELLAKILRVIEKQEK